MSGLVVLKPGEAMHRHSTESNDEEIVMLAGKATLVIGARRPWSPSPASSCTSRRVADLVRGGAADTTHT